MTNFVSLFSWQIKHKGAAEFSLGVLNFLREQDSSGALDFERVQDIRVKVGYEVFEKVELIFIFLLYSDQFKSYFLSYLQ